MIDHPRFPISQLHLGQFPDSMEFECWKVDFNAEVCAKLADPHLTMHWFKEVETAKSIDELMTTRSIVVRSDFPDYDMLLDKHVRFRKRVPCGPIMFLN